MEQISEEKSLENITGGNSEAPSEVICPLCGARISLKKKGLFSSSEPGVCTCGYKVGAKWL